MLSLFYCFYLCVIRFLQLISPFYSALWLSYLFTKNTWRTQCTFPVNSEFIVKPTVLHTDDVWDMMSESDYMAMCWPEIRLSLHRGQQAKLVTIHF